MVRKQEKSDLTGLIKWKFQKVTFFFAHPLLDKNLKIHTLQRKTETQVLHS